jgi:hypothetical protein
MLHTTLDWSLSDDKYRGYYLEMSDRYQQWKGILGQEIVKLYLEKIKKWKIIGEESPVVGLDSRARIDIVARDSSNRNIPVEVKFQEYNLEYYGTAFEHILNELGNKRDVFIKHKGRRIKLSKPLLFLWYPPSPKIKKNVDFYSQVELITFSDAIESLREKLGARFSKIICKRVNKIIADFLLKQRCGLTERQKQILRELYPKK